MRIIKKMIMTILRLFTSEKVAYGCLMILVQTIYAQDTTSVKDTLSAAAKSDSAAAAYKIEALKQALGGDSYQPVAPIANYQPPDFGGVAIRMTIGLGVILILLYVLYILARKIRNVESPLASSGQSAVQLLDSKFLGSGRHLFLIKAGAERVLIVGASSENMRTLSEIQGEEAKNILEVYGSKSVSAAQFSATVDHLLRRFRREGG
ncbi:MAG: flagellar biosynthetic protein FliO [Fibromonadaceae bacterium]|jgi:flagellar biogenesis protein FliO|nr:flagellar biosynthetic protein FliO [Fibromonadaceae bacterium]